MNLDRKKFKSQFISWSMPACAIEKIFLEYKNGNSGTNFPGLIIANALFIPTKLVLARIEHQLKPGIVIYASSIKLRISAGKFAIDLYEVLDCNGKILSSGDLIDFFGIKQGFICADDKESKIILANKFYKKYLYPYEDFWVNQIVNVSPLAISFAAREKYGHVNNIGKAYDEVFELPSEVKKMVSDVFGRKTKMLQNVVLTIFLIYLYRINNCAKYSVFFGNSKISKNLGDFGVFFAKYLPLTIDCDYADDFASTLQNVIDKIDMMQQRYTYSNDIALRYDDILEKIKFIKCLVVVTDSFCDFVLPEDFECAFLLSNNGAKFNLKVHAVADDSSVELVRNIYTHICTLLNYVVVNQKGKIVDLPLLSLDEYKKIVEDWNNTDIPYDNNQTIVDLFERQVAVTPHNTAARYLTQQFTYLQLNSISNKLANLLRRQNIRANSIVGVCLDRGLMMIVAIMGVLKAGGAYVPLDTELPIERLKFILHDTQTAILLVQSDLVKKFTEYSGDILVLDSFMDDNYDDMENPKKIISSQDLAYVIYTSGTTGVPKGVQITHGSLINHMLWMRSTFSFGQRDVVLQKTIFSFDASIWELLIALISGGGLVFAAKDAHKDPALLIETIVENGITTLQLVPSMLREFLRHDNVIECKTLRHVFSGGELLPREIRKHFFQKFKIPLYNLYGPTETTIECTFHACQNTEEDFNVDSIGKPISNTKVYVLDSHLKIVPVGIAGQLFIGGDCLAKGFINSPGLTAEKFIVNPLFPGKMKKIYRTGDLVRWLPNGCLEYLGRLNDQVKIRGFRVELGEIEAHLLSYDLIEQCAAVAREDNENARSQLVAYLTISGKDTITANDLREFLREKLPEYMIPNKFIVLDKLPLSSNGKVDKKKLFDLEVQQLSSGNKYVLPVSDDERMLVNIWSEALGVTKIGTEDNFFSLGGSSLLALQILTLVRKHWGVDLSLRDFFELPTISKFCQAIYEARAQGKYNKSSPVVVLQSHGTKTPLFLIHPVGGTVFWYMHLAKYLGDERPIYGIQDPGVELKRPIFSSIQELSKFYLDAIRNIQPVGPYIIGGASFGATVAVEISRLLEDAGEKILFIPVFDGWAIYPDKLRDDNYFKSSMQRQHDDLRNQFDAKNISDVDSLFELQWSRLHLLWNYTMLPIRQKIVLFKARDLLPVFATIDAKLNYWDEYAIQSVESNLIPGNHETMFQEPNVKILAEALKNVLQNF